MIKEIDSEKLDNTFKLTTESYQNVSRLQESNWGGVLKQDLHAARAIIIVGLSLNYDLDLSRLLFDPAFKQKTIIVCGKDKSAIQREQLEEYGSVQDMGLNDFAAEIIKNKTTISLRTRIQLIIITSVSCIISTGIVPLAAKLTQFTTYFFMGNIQRTLLETRKVKTHKIFA